MTRAQRLVEGVGDLAERVEDGADRQGEVEVGDLLDLLVDRHNAARIHAHVGVVHQRVLRVRQLKLLVEQAELAAEQRAFARAQDAVVRLRTEERDGGAAALVVDDDGVRHRTLARLHASLRHRLDAGGEHDVLAEFELTERAAGVRVDVAAREVVEQVAHRHEVTRLRELPRAGSEDGEQWRVERHLTHGSPP